MGSVSWFTKECPFIHSLGTKVLGISMGTTLAVYGIWCVSTSDSDKRAFKHYLPLLRGNEATRIFWLSKKHQITKPGISEWSVGNLIIHFRAVVKGVK